MVKEEKLDESPKDNYKLADVTVQTKVMVVNSQENKAITIEESLVDILNKLDKILKAVA